MSWQAYVDQSLVGSGNVDKAAIFSVKGDSVWATTPGFAVSPKEMQAIVHAFNDKGENGVKQVQTAGLHVAEQRYIVHKADDQSLYGKKGKEGVVIVKNVQSLLVTHYPEHVQPGQAADTVEKLGEYLRGLGY